MQLLAQPERRRLERPIGGQVGHLGHADAAWQPAVDRGLDQIGREEGKRDRGVHLQRAAAGPRCDLVRVGDAICNNVVEPPAPARDGGDQGRASLRPDRPGRRRGTCRLDNLPMPALARSRPGKAEGRGGGPTIVPFGQPELDRI